MTSHKMDNFKVDVTANIIVILLAINKSITLATYTIADNYTLLPFHGIRLPLMFYRPDINMPTHQDPLFIDKTINVV